MKELFSLGELYPSDFLKPEEHPLCPPVEMKLMLDDNGAVCLEKSAPSNVMWGEKYWYRSGINNSMKKHLQGIVTEIQSVYKLDTSDCFLDIACNDGTLLSFVPNNLMRIGIDPCNDSFKKEAEKNADLIIQDYFSYNSFCNSTLNREIKPKVITCISMFYDLKKPYLFLQDIEKVLDDNGIFVVQMSYTPLMIKQMAFDNFCHEHFWYWSLFNFKSLVEKNGFKIMDCQLNDCNGGSFRVYMMKQNADIKLFSVQPYRDVCKMRIDSLLEYEKSLKLDSPETWMEFYNRINELKDQTVSFIKIQKSRGKKVFGYGASTKGNTLLQYFGLDHTLIDGIAERSEYKWGLKTIGTNIPIYSEEYVRNQRPDFLFILPWHFLSEFLEREKDLLKSGTKFIVPCPKFEIIGLNH